MTLYQRDGTRVKHDWTAEPVDTAKQAVVDVVGEPDEWPAQVSQDEAEAIRERFSELQGATE